VTEIQPGTAEYWDQRYASIGDTSVSWFQDRPSTSLALIAEVAGPHASVVDVGGGASRLVDHLLAEGYRDLTVVDLSQEALRASRDRVGEAPVTWIAIDVREWQPARSFDVWHDRAAYHFLTDTDDQQRYWHLVRASVTPGGHVIVSTFAADGPEMCSGLPVTRYSHEQLRQAMGEEFEILRTGLEEHVTPTGGTQSFQWTLARRI
jgi:2-polyprenyl-3-methyl-5-hydroxy-6-metoxy-1,4-benzoquinol methylase